ncbi:MAG: hypothetical protein IPO26_21400 [Saprospiraceae bacterium]|nr:hypothetical protein [Saprospiraceae bacterium]
MMAISSTVVSPSHQYTNNGSYTVVQTVTNGCGSVQSTQVITIALAPVTSFSSSYTGPICRTICFVYQYIYI